MNLITPATINKSFKSPTISFNYRPLIDILINHLHCDVVEKLQLEGLKIYYNITYDVKANIDRHTLGTCHCHHIGEDARDNLYVVYIRITTVNNLIMKVGDISLQSFCSIISSTIIHELRHIWQIVNNAYDINNNNISHDTDIFEMYQNLPYEVDAREYQEQYIVNSHLLDRLIEDIVQTMINNNQYTISVFIDINRFLADEYINSLMITLFRKDDNIQSIKFIPHYFNTNMVEESGDILTIYYNPTVFDFDSLQDRSLDSISMYIAKVLASMSYEYNGISFHTNNKCMDSIYRSIRLQLPQYIFNRK